MLQFKKKNKIYKNTICKSIFKVTVFKISEALCLILSNIVQISKNLHSGENK